MKKNALISAILTIALCASVIAGSTFALFTSKSETNIALTAAKVEMTADITNLTLASVRPATVAEVRDAADGGDTTIIEDEFGGQYVYADREDGTFANGGTANFKDAVLTLDRITPGDKVSFDVVGANTSDVTIQYRYVIECMDGKELMRGMLISVEGVTYEFLGSYTSGWKALTPGTDITPVPVVVEFPVTAGNEFQELSTSIKITVEAVQGNADVAGSDKPVVEFLDGIAVDLAGRTMPINAGVVNTGSLELSNGSIAVDQVGFENLGNATLNNVVIDGGTPGTVAYGYGVIGRGEDSVTVLNDVTVHSANGAIGAVDGATVTFNSGDVEVGSAATSGRYLFYAAGENTVITINDGNFRVPEKLSNGTTQNNKRAYICAMDGATVYVTGGTFGKAPFRSAVVFADTGSKYSDGIVTNATGTVIITGGTFGFDPSAWVKDGYKATKVDNRWVVTPESVNVAATSDSLIEALEGGKDVMMMDDIKIDPAGMSNAYGTTGINVKNGQTIDGNGNTLDIKGAGGTWDSGINTTGGLIKNLTVTGSFRGIFINHNSTHSEKVVLENVIIDGTTYTISCDQGNNQGLEAINSTFNGWTSYAATIGEVTFTNCSFGKGNGYAFCRPYAPTAFVGCDFEAGFAIDPRAAITFENCTIDGVALTAENLATLVTANVANASVK